MFDPLKDETGPLAAMRRSGKMTARVAMIFCFICVLLVVISVISFGVSSATPLIGCVFLFFIFIFWLNTRGVVHLSSYLLCVVPSLVLMAITIYLKGVSPGDDLHYFDSRIILLGYCVLPGLILSQRDPYMLYSSLAINLLCVVLYDPVHELIGVGYYQGGFLNTTYYHINTICILIAGGIVVATLMLKGIVLSEEEKNRLLSEEKELKNKELLTQNQEILVQSEQLSSAFRLIEKQKQQLELYTTQLEELVNLKSMDLSKSNEELQKHNSELLQFSYSVSHNVRGPVARLLGLTGLIDRSDPHLSDENKRILDYVHESSHELDIVIRELSRIIDIRNELYTVKEKVFFEDEWQHVRTSLAGLIEPEMEISTDFTDAPFIYTIRPFLHSILYNLVSNAIRYRSSQRLLRVQIKTSVDDRHIRISVADNGLGINLEQFGDSLFGMYKRFHTHVQGRGLGLFLVKTQVEALHGQITVESHLNVGTMFTANIQIPGDIEGQVCFDCEFGTVLYNARIDSMGLTWKRHVTSAEFRELLTKCLEMLHVYGTPRWIADLRNLEVMSSADYAWFSDSVISESAQMGLRIVAVISTEINTHELRAKVAQSAARSKVDIRFFETRSQAETWMES
jgi:signal transduction histidine kinase